MEFLPLQCDICTPGFVSIETDSICPSFQRELSYTVHLGLYVYWPPTLLSGMDSLSQALLNDGVVDLEKNIFVSCTVAQFNWYYSVFTCLASPP